MDLLYNYLLTNALRDTLRKGALHETVDKILHLLKENTKADYIAITVWDTDKDIPYLHKYISDDGLKIIPGKPGFSPLGVCMLEKRPVRGKFEEFPRAASYLSKAVGEVLCLPIEIPEPNLIGAVGIGRKKGREPFTEWDDATLQIASNILSAIISIRILQDLLDKERKILAGLLWLIETVMTVSNPKLRYTNILQIMSRLFKAEYALLGKVNLEKKVIEPISYLGLERPNIIPFGKGMLGTCAAENKIKFFRSYPMDRVPEGYEKDAQRVGCAFVAPVNVQGKLEFVLAIARTKYKEPFSTVDYYFFHLFYKVLSIVFSIQKIEEEKEKFAKLKSRIEKLDSVGTLAGGIAHDFNNIINVIMGYAQIGMETSEDEEIKQFFEHILKQCHRAAELTSKILLISREDFHETGIVDLKALLQDALVILKRTLPENIEIIFSDDGREPYLVKGEPSQISTMIFNLASNAKDAMPHGGRLTLRLRKSDPPAGMDTEGSVIVLEVEDTGKGIPEDQTERIFDPFFTTKDPGKGTGLGLSQVYRTVSNMGGLIDVKSAENQGTTFIIYIPEAPLH